MAKKIRIGVDFDGVVAYNPFRILRAPVTIFKRKILKIKRVRFYIPQKTWERFIWSLMHQSSLLPAKGVKLLRKMAQNNNLEFHLVTARYNFLGKSLYAWLNRQELTQLFKTININTDNEQPHLYKERIVNKLKFDYFIEDNWDVVSHLNSKTKAKVLWIYNILDRKTPYQHKFPYLEKALEKVAK